jgi:hypothetical protein
MIVDSGDVVSSAVGRATTVSAGVLGVGLGGSLGGGTGRVQATAHAHESESESVRASTSDTR